MGNFNRNRREGGGRSSGGFGGGGRSFGGRRSFGGGNRFSRDRDNDRGDRQSQMYDAECAKCGKRCQVPFRPTGERPVYCNECYGSKDNSNREQTSSNKTQSGISQDQFKILSSKLDKIIKILDNLELTEDGEDDDLESAIDEELDEENEDDEDIAGKNVILVETDEDEDELEDEEESEELEK